MNIYYFDPSLDCSLFFISLSFHPITLCLPLAFSIFTHYPLTYFLIPSRTVLLPTASLFNKLTFLLHFSPPLSPHAPHLPLTGPHLHPQLKPASLPQSWSWNACTQSGPRFKVPTGNTRIIASCNC